MRSIVTALVVVFGLACGGTEVEPIGNVQCFCHFNCEGLNKGFKAGTLGECEGFILQCDSDGGEVMMIRTSCEALQSYLDP